jgi:hypothetical protein
LCSLFIRYTKVRIIGRSPTDTLLGEHISRKREFKTDGNNASAAQSRETQRSRQTVKIDFFKLQDEAGGRIEFQNALRAASRSHGRNRSRVVFGERVDLYECHETGSIIEGEIGRIRMNDTPAIANSDCTFAEIALDDDQGIAERTAFLFDSNLSVLVLHSRKEAVSASRIAGFCDKFAGHNIDSFLLRPLLRGDATKKIRSMNVVKKVEVEYVRGAADAITNPDASTRSFVRNLENLQGETLSVTVSSGRKKENHLSFQTVTDLIRTALTGKDESVQKLTISGRNAGDERLFIDLLEDRLRVPVIIEFRGRSASYHQRRSAVRKAYDSNLPLLQPQ